MANESNDEEKFYFGLADTTFKERFRSHIKDFKHEKYENSTELVKYMWQLKRDNISFSIKWASIAKVYQLLTLLKTGICLVKGRNV